jgi:hypothetical protein
VNGTNRSRTQVNCIFFICPVSGVIIITAAAIAIIIGCVFPWSIAIAVAVAFIVSVVTVRDQAFGCGSRDARQFAFAIALFFPSTVARKTAPNADNNRNVLECLFASISIPIVDVAFGFPGNIFDIDGVFVTVVIVAVAAAVAISATVITKPILVVVALIFIV